MGKADTGPGWGWGGFRHVNSSETALIYGRVTSALSPLFVCAERIITGEMIHFAGGLRREGRNVKY